MDKSQKPYVWVVSARPPHEEILGVCNSLAAVRQHFHGEWIRSSVSHGYLTYRRKAMGGSPALIARRRELWHALRIEESGE